MAGSWLDVSRLVWAFKVLFVCFCFCFCFFFFFFYACVFCLYFVYLCFFLVSGNILNKSLFMQVEIAKNLLLFGKTMLREEIDASE